MEKLIIKIKKLFTKMRAKFSTSCTSTLIKPTRAVDIKMYTLRFPFSISQKFIIEGTEINKQIGNLNYVLSKQNQFYVLTVSNFPTKKEANDHIKKIWTGLMSLLLHCKVPSNAEFESVVVVKDEDIDYGSKPAIYPSNKQIKTLTGYAPTVSVTDTTIDNMLKLISEGISFPKSEEIINNSKLRTAFELYGAYFTEFSANAKFITLVLVLETLISDIPRTPLVISLMNQWEKEATDLYKTLKPDTEDKICLESLIKVLLVRKEESIRRKIKMAMHETQVE